VRHESKRDVLCIAGGSGLSPILSIVRSLAVQAGAARTVDVFYGGRTAADLCLAEALAEAGAAAHIRLHSVVSDPGHELSEGWEGATGFVHEEVARRLGDAAREREVYFAGPPPMATATQRMLVLELGVPVEQIHFDRFF
jgi:toluene monooxygenase electron transfer component